jgi:hypothetical protein
MDLYGCSSKPNSGTIKITTTLLTVTIIIAIFSICCHLLQLVYGLELNAFCDLLRKLSNIYMSGAICMDLYGRSSKANLDVEPQRALTIRQAETVHDIASKYGWLNVINYLAMIDLRRCKAICLACVDIDCFFEACLQVLGLTYTASREDIEGKSNLLLQRVRLARANTTDVLRVTRRLINKLVSMFGDATSIGAVQAQFKASYSNMLKTCPLQDLPTIQLRIKEFFLQPNWPPMAIIELTNLDRLEQEA